MSSLNLSIYSILLVDDVPFARQTLNRVLLGMGKPTVVEAENGQKALEILRSKRTIDFVISDFNMPYFNGLQLLRAVRSGDAEVHRSLPFAMLTGFSDKHLVDAALALDVNAFLVKPVSKRTLSERLGKMLSRGDEEWLKSAGHYGRIAFEEAEETIPEPAEVARKLPSTPPPQEEAPPGEVALDPRQLVDRASVMRRLSSLSGKFEDEDLLKEIGGCVDRLIDDHGGEVATRIVSYLDGLVRRKVVGVGDLPRLLEDSRKPVEDPVERAHPASDLKDGEYFFELQDVPPGAVLTRNIYTEDGSLFMTWGTELSTQVISILMHLDRLNVLALTKPEPWISGVYVSLRSRRGGATLKPKPAPRRQAQPASRAAQPAAAPPPRLPQGVSERRVSPRSVQPGAVLTRDIYTADGRLYLHAGAQLSPRMVSILNDLDQLGHMKSELWVRA